MVILMGTRWYIGAFAMSLVGLLSQNNFRENSGAEVEKEIETLIAKAEKELGFSLKDREYPSEFVVDLQELAQISQDIKDGKISADETGIAEQIRNIINPGDPQTQEQKPKKKKKKKKKTKKLKTDNQGNGQ